MKLMNTLFFICFTLFSYAQNEGFLYGTVETEDHKTFTGQIRWGTEEALWTDMFNASKMENEYVDYLSRADYDKFIDNRSQHNTWWEKTKAKYTSYSSDFTHQFTCQFGNIKKITKLSTSKIALELRNGDTKKLDGEGYNDIGTKILVYVPDLGKVEINWEDMVSVTFQETPSSSNFPIGKMLYGKVEAWDGAYEGLIQWDKDERVTTDILNGEDNGREMEIEFGNISTMRKRGSGCEVTLKNGQEIFLVGSNDVDNGNRGIVITNPEKGMVTVNWEDFKNLAFMETPTSLKGYGNFENADFIEGVVLTISGEKFQGRIAYDLDEAYNFEILNGEKGGILYEIPFSSIKQIKPKITGKSLVVLKTGEEVILEKSQDVSEDHTGILVFENGAAEPKYISWKEVEQLDLK